MYLLILGFGQCWIVAECPLQEVDQAWFWGGDILRKAIPQETKYPQ